LNPPQPSASDPTNAAVDHGTFALPPARHRNATPKAVKSQVAAWKIPSHSMLYFMLSRSTGGTTLDNMLCHCKS
jgi:hypothetical protein